MLRQGRWHSHEFPVPKEQVLQYILYYLCNIHSPFKGIKKLKSLLLYRATTYPTSTGYANGESISNYLTEPSWRRLLEPEFNKDYFRQLETHLSQSTKTIYPPKHEVSRVIFVMTVLIFTAFNLTPFENVKVIIIGQDPYLIREVCANFTDIMALDKHMA